MAGRIISRTDMQRVRRVSVSDSSTTRTKTHSPLFTLHVQTIDLQGQEFTEEQFESSIKKAKKPLTALADKARKSIEEGKAQKFPK